MRGTVTTKGESGQIAVEYVLLLVVGVAIYMLIAQTMVSRNPNHRGFVIKEWRSIVKLIGGDVIEKK